VSCEPVPLAPRRRQSHALLVLALTVALAAAFRCGSLDASGFAEDEIDILGAVESYRQLNFVANAEHPMLAKLAAFGSVESAEKWNALVRPLHFPGISGEAALRLPMAIAGALTAGLMFLLARELFGAEIAVWAGALWALDVNATAINRTAKEDTLFLFFFLAAAWLYERGKREGRVDVSRARRWYTASGGSFGLMLASKYMPHYFGLYGLFNTVTDPTPGDNCPRKPALYGALGATFLAANFGLLIPANWRHILLYLRGRTTIHTGYVFAHRLYVNSMAATPWGVPWTYYFAFLATKVPIVVLLACGAGLVQMVRHGQRRGFAFTRIFFVFFLLPYSLVATKFVRYMLPLFAIIDLLAAVGIVWGLRQLARRVPSDRLRPVAVRAAAVFVVLMLISAELVAYPFPSLYQNALGARIAPPGDLFPDDEFNDSGVREAVDAIVRTARPGAVIASDATGVVAAYLARSGRTDLHSISLAHDGLPLRAVETWAIVQDGHVYFESEALVAQLRARMPPWLEIRIGPALAAQVFLLPDDSEGDHLPR
jgi:4-amino-4-deoxy-L-arabinose transferase-like glycosyltransferase